MLSILKKRCIARVLVFVTVFVMMFWLIPLDMNHAFSATSLSNPKIIGDESVTWDCVEFGTYPQSRVEKSNEIYDQLENSVEWDSNNEIILDGIKYRKETRSGDFSDYVNYYKCEPIKWRVLSVDDEKAFLLSEKSIDAKKYNEQLVDVTWETSTIRSWLNGYGAESNQCELGYESNNFINVAFNNEQQKTRL